MGIPVLETARLIIRPFREDDLEAVLEVLDDGPATGARAREERASWLRWTVLSYQELDRLWQPPYGERAIVLQSTQKVIGACGLVPSFVPLDRASGAGFTRHFFPEFGLFYALSRQARGQGYAAEAARALSDWAFRELGLARIVATTTHDNARSIAVMERLGMRILRNTEPEPHWLQVVGVLDAAAPPVSH